MSEETTEAEVTEEATTEETTTESTTTESTAAFSDTFIASLENEELKGAAIWDRLKGKSADEFGQYVKELQSFAGRKGDIPGADAGDDEKKAFLDKLRGGVESAEKYDFEASSEFQELVGAESMPYYESIIGAIKENAFALGATNEQAEGALGALLDIVGAQEEATAKGIQEQSEANETALRNEWGDGFDAIKGGVEAMMKNNGMTQEQVDWAKEAGILNEPAFAIPLAKIAAKFADDPEIGHHQTFTQEGVQDQINDLNSQFAGMLKAGDAIPQHMKDKMNTLFGKLN